MNTKKDGKIWVEGLDSVLSDESLAGRKLRDSLGTRDTITILPDLWVIKIGGQSIMDRGRAAVHPILE